MGRSLLLNLGEKGTKGDKGEPGIGERGEKGPPGPIGDQLFSIHFIAVGCIAFGDLFYHGLKSVPEI